MNCDSLIERLTEFFVQDYYQRVDRPQYSHLCTFPEAFWKKGEKNLEEAVYAALLYLVGKNEDQEIYEDTAAIHEAMLGIVTLRYAKELRTVSKEVLRDYAVTTAEETYEEIKRLNDSSLGAV